MPLPTQTMQYWSCVNVLVQLKPFSVPVKHLYVKEFYIRGEALLLLSAHCSVDFVISQCYVASDQGPNP